MYYSVKCMVYIAHYKWAYMYIARRCVLFCRWILQWRNINLDVTQYSVQIQYTTYNVQRKYRTSCTSTYITYGVRRTMYNVQVHCIFNFTSIIVIHCIRNLHSNIPTEQLLYRLNCNEKVYWSYDLWPLAICTMIE